MLFRQIFDPKLAQYAYLIGCQQTKEALLIDPERDIDRYVELAASEGLEITAVAETHIHADFLSGAREFAEAHDTMVYLSDEGTADWKYEWVKRTKGDGSPYRFQLLKDGDSFKIGNIEVTAIHTPGHTPEHISFVVIDRGGGASTPIGIATGDFVFVGDLGRPDLLEQAAGLHGVQEPSARELFGSLPKFTSLEDYIQVWPAHGAGSTCGKALGAVPTTTVGYEKLYNASLSVAKQGEGAFVQAILDGQPEPQMYFARMKRDNKVGAPVLGGLPKPQRMTADELASRSEDVLVVDTRRDRTEYMRRHIPGSLYSAANKSFLNYVGSLVLDETVPMVLIAEDDQIEGLVRSLIRIGYDNVVGYATEQTLESYFESGGASESTREIGFDELDDALSKNPGRIVDVRFSSEHEAHAIPGSINASYTRLPEYVESRIPRDETLYVHCKSGGRAASATSYLASLGLDVTYLNGEVEPYVKGGDGVSEESTEAVPA